MHFSTSVPMLISRQFNDEVVLANYETGIYYSLTGTGADIWLGMRAGRSVDAIALALCANGAIDVTAVASAVRSFVDKLLAERIVAPLDNPPEQCEWMPATNADFSEPVLERYDDLRDLLLLDPIHDVADSGWPMRKSDVD
jgi:hypothetical protein